MDKPDFSLILACFNEEDVLAKSVERIESTFSKAKLNYEIIFVDDKSGDNTANIIKDIISKHPGWKVIEHNKNMGRGQSVSDGLKSAKAPVVGFIDIDLSTSPWYLLRLIDEVENGADIASAMRVYKLKPKTLFRWIISKGYNFVMRLVLWCNLQDTETGCKVFNRERILPLLGAINSAHWFWDTEIMLRAHVLGYRIVEVPTIFIRDNLVTTVRFFKDIKDYIFSLVRFRRELNKLREK